jgi:hypothetical protein
VESIVGDAGRYLALSSNALERARRELTWARWAERMMDILGDAAGQSCPKVAVVKRGVQPA